MEDLKSRINTAYTTLSGDDRIDRAYKSIPDSSCTNLPSSFQNPCVYGSIFILLGFAEAGGLLGRKIFLIDQIDPAERTTYVAFANTAMGVVTLIFGFLGVLAQIVGISTLNVILIVLGFMEGCCQLFPAGNLRGLTS